MQTAQIFKPYACEADVIDFNGRLIVLYVPRSPPNDDVLTACDYFTGEVIAEAPAMGLNLGCALMVGGTLHLWATDSARKNIMHRETTDLVNWSAPVTVWPVAPGNPQKIFNTSVCHDPVGNRYVMAYETSEPGLLDFNIRFFTSANVNGPWAPHGGLFNTGGADKYTACPLIKFCGIDNYFYVFFLAHESGRFITRVARAADPAGPWSQSAYLALGPTPDCTSQSDFSFIEFDGITRGIFCAGDQVNVLDLCQMWDPATADGFCRYFSI